MRKILVESWKARNSDGVEIEESILSVLSALITNRKTELMPRGLDKFRLYGRLSKSFDNALENKVLELEESDYLFLKNIVESDISAIWGTNSKILNAVENFLNAKME